MTTYRWKAVRVWGAHQMYHNDDGDYRSRVHLWYIVVVDVRGTYMSQMGLTHQLPSSLRVGGVVVWFFASVFHGDKTVCTSYYPLSHKLFITIHVSSMMIVMAMTTIWCSRTQETHKTKHNIGIGNMRQCLTKIYNGQRRPSCNEITTLCLAFDKLF